MATIIDTVVAEITENWRSAVLPDEEEQEFLHTLHDPDTNARHLLYDQCLTPPDLTDAQWDEVLERLRGEFPNEESEEEEEAEACCEACGDHDAVVHSFGCVALCETCSMADGEPHCPRTHADHESDPCGWCVSAWAEIDGKDEENE